MSNKRSVAEVASILDKAALAETIAEMWVTARRDRKVWEDQRLELRNFLFATDTSTTTAKVLPWKHSTTLPKLTQIRDNLHANYMSALFPNDQYVQWDPGDQGAAAVEKSRAARQYVLTKARESGFESTVSELLLDYIDNGNVFFDVIHVNEQHENDDGTVTQGYYGPKLIRYGYQDIVSDPRAASFDNSWKITRAVMPFGEVMARADAETENGFLREAITRSANLRNGIHGLSTDDLNLVTAYDVDGFGQYHNYLASGYVEVLTFYGSIYDVQAQKLYKNRQVSIIDRLWVLDDRAMPSWYGKCSIGHCGWRRRPDNLYAMGPLDNLVGMQYKLDHLENAKADATDLAVQPPLAIRGLVEEFDWEPGAEIMLGDDGQITELGKNLGAVLAVESQQERLEQRMEEFAGAPKTAMGIRTPGEKTAFEMQTLEQAASRIFQHRLRQFEIDVVERVLNMFLEIGRRNMKASELVPIMDDDLGAVSFLTITKEDLTSAGKLRAVGARHFAASAVLVQNLMAVVNSGLWNDPAVRAHFSGKSIARIIERLLNLDQFQLFGENIAITEAAETAQLVAQGEEEVAVTNMTPAEAPIDAP
jgi:hypothetical protein